MKFSFSKRLSGFFMALLVVAITTHAQPVFAQQNDIIRAIAVEGAGRVEPSTVRSYLLVREGDAFDAHRIDRSLKSLFATGLFADVSMDREGQTLVIKVVENPVINRIAFEGNKRIKDEELLKEITLRPRVIYTRTKVQNDVSRLQEIYRREGRFAAKIEPKVIQLDQNRIDLVFELDEGALTKVQNIRFIGNNAFDDGDLREVIRTVETRWYRFLTSDDTYDPDRLTFDGELLRRFYLKSGYADFRVLSTATEMTPDRKNFFITFTLEEGERYRLGDISINSKLPDLKPEDLVGGLELISGDWYSATLVESTIDQLTDASGNAGYAFVDVRPQMTRNRESRIIDIVFEVNEGPRVFVERIDIKGNVRTLDEVIRREFKLVEGDAFNVSKMRRSLSRIQALDFFAKVDLDQKEGSAPDKTIVEVAVEEKSTGSLSLGVGYTTGVGPTFEFSVQEKNLVGRGQKLSLAFQYSAKRKTANLSFTEPYFMDRDVSAGFDVYRSLSNQQKSSSFDSEETGLTLRFGYPITEALRQSWRYSISQNKVSNVKDTASLLIKAQEGNSILSEVGHTLAYDRRNSTLHPTDGYYIRMNNSLAGLGGNARYFKNHVSAVSYTSIREGWVLSFRGAAGVVNGLGEDVNITDRYFLGGSSLRGFATAGIGPRDKNTNDALGGELTYSGSVELLLPLGLPPELGISGKLFSDFGSVTRVNPTSANVLDSGSIRSSAGVGVAWISPIGPIGLDYAVPITKESYDDTEAFRISFGTRF